VHWVAAESLLEAVQYMRQQFADFQITRHVWWAWSHCFRDPRWTEPSCCWGETFPLA
jgi:hypothetical protein